MGYGMLPLYPPGGECGCRESCGCRENYGCRDSCVRMPLFGGAPTHCDGCGCSQTVRLENPCRPGECAEVELSVDSCGNLVICVHRDGPRCTQRRRRC